MWLTKHFFNEDKIVDKKSVGFVVEMDIFMYFVVLTVHKLNHLMFCMPMKVFDWQYAHVDFTKRDRLKNLQQRQYNDNIEPFFSVTHKYQNVASQ